MADYEIAEQTIRRFRYVLSTPSNGAELSKALMHAARHRADGLGKQPVDLPDDALHVSTEDDAIVIWWEIEK